MHPRRLRLDRRRFLQAAGSCIALPALPSLTSRASGATAPSPKRLVFLGFGWGCTYESWYPKIDDIGPDYAITKGLSPLAAHKADFTVVQNLTNRRSNEGHWGSTFWLSSANRFAVPGSTFSNAISCDQAAAELLGRDTRYASIQLSCRNAEGSGHGPGLSLSWDERGKPMAGWETPFDAYARLFGVESEPAERQRQRLLDKRSALDAVALDARSLGRVLNAEDARKLDEYLESVRDIELRLTKEERWIGMEKPLGAIEPPPQNAAGIDEIKLMYDLIVAAFKTDQTRVATYRQPVESLLVSMQSAIASHDMSHYSPGIQTEVSEARDAKQSDLLAGLFDRLKQEQQPDGSSLFDHTLVVYGSNIRQWHSLDNCPTLVAGGTSFLRHQGHIVMPDKNTPLANLWLTLLQAVGTDAQTFADSTGTIDALRTV
jgi:hypothetical protein